MTAGLFAGSRHFLGDELLPPTVSNPLGYFEDRTINHINNALIDRLVKWRRYDTIRRVFAPLAHADTRLYPSAAPRRLRRIRVEDALIEKMRALTSRQPFLFKDPRFCVTLPCWTPVLPSGMKYIIVFRDPFKTAESYIRNGKNIYNLDVPVGWPFHSYAVNYARLLRTFGKSDDAIFVHYDQILSGSHVRRLCAFLRTTHINADHPREELRRSTGSELLRGTLPERPVRSAVKTYRRLCDRSNFAPDARDLRSWRDAA